MIVKIKDIREKSTAELNQELESLRKELFQSRMNYHARRLENISSMKETRKSIARILTVLKEKAESEE